MEHLQQTLTGILEARNPRPESARDASFASLSSLFPCIGITKRTLKHLEAIQLVRDQRETGKQELAYNARPFVLCGFRFAARLKNNLPTLATMGTSSLKSRPTLDTASLTARTA